MGWFSWCYKFRSQAARALGMDLQHQQVRYAQTLAQYVTPGSVWLDLGCGHQFYPRWARIGSVAPEELASRPRLLCGLDGDFRSIRQHPLITNRVLGDVNQLPFRDSTFTVISANMVMEHVADPAAALRELERTLAPGGVFIFHTTNRRFYQVAIASLLPQKLKNAIIYALTRRRSEDVYPTEYKINTPNAVRRLAAASGMKLRDLRMISSAGELALLGPVVVLELLVTRLLETPLLRNFRSNMIVILQKEGAAQPNPSCPCIP
jgi:SAM-dependent methyltransferase